MTEKTPMVYGPPIELSRAKMVMAAAEKVAETCGVSVAIAIVDSASNLVMLLRLDNAQLSASRLAEAKARTSVEFRRPTKAFEDDVARGGIGLRALSLGAVTSEGGVPLIIAGKIVGAIGVSGAEYIRVAEIAEAGAAAVA